MREWHSVDHPRKMLLIQRKPMATFRESYSIVALTTPICPTRTARGVVGARFVDIGCVNA